MKNVLRVSTHQPSFLPWIGLLSKIKNSDYFVLLDDVQFNQRSFQHRAYYSNNNTRSFLTLSIEKKNLFKDRLKINEIRLKHKIQNEIYYKLFDRYNDCKGWVHLEPLFNKVFLEPKEKMIDIIYPIFFESLKLLNIKTKIFKSSEFNFTQKKSDLMLEITKNFNGNIYLSGLGGKNYLNEIIFNKNNIQIEYMKFQHPQYRQKNFNKFVDGCFALEWYLENPKECVDYFKN